MNKISLNIKHLEFTTAADIYSKFKAFYYHTPNGSIKN